MHTTHRTISFRLILVSLIALISLVAISQSARGLAAQGASDLNDPLAPNATFVTELTLTDDARTQSGSPDVNFGNGYIYLWTLNGHVGFAQFDLLQLPANATIDAAALQLTFVGVYTGPNDIEIGRAEGVWDEATLTWNTQPAITWGGPTQTVILTGTYSWNVTSLVNQWHTGALPNYGFAMRGNGGNILTVQSKETGIGPRLIITYTVPPPTGARPDLGDAPDSSNPLGITNTAYPGVPGHFPTVWSGTPITQPAGPRHANQTGEGILGDFLSRENEAYTGLDEDGVNNILNGGANNSNNDRGDDGWRNRTASFNNCEQTTLRVRVSKALTATLNKMYLNVWFDGTHDGDWNDHGPCLPHGEELQIPATEWIVQDYIVDMTGIAPGGFADITINTETVLNTSPDTAHWMRFMLSESRAVQSGGYADGRGPNPANGSYQFGETEDVLQRPQPPGETGNLALHKTVGSNSFPVEPFDIVTYTVNLRHIGGSQAIGAELRDVLPDPLVIIPTRDSSNVPHYVRVESDGGVSPLQASLDAILPPGGGPPLLGVKWRGTLDPDSAITLTFKVRTEGVWCAPNQQTMTFHNTAQARPITSSTNITAHVAFDAKCTSYDDDYVDVVLGGVLTPSITQTLDLPNFDFNPDIPWQIHNGHATTVTLGITRLLNTNLPAGLIELPGFQKIMLGPNMTRTLNYPLDLANLITNELDLPDEVSVVAGLRFCILPGGRGQDCSNGLLVPGLMGERWPLTITVRPHDLGDAPDTTNHAGMAMAAYPAVQANYPTVYDPGLGQPIGPLHFHPRPLHLGQNVSREAEADIGPDEDPLNNIEPAANDPDNDRFDDGIRPDLWALNHCQTTTVPVKVLITPQAVNFFQQQNTPAYINIWLDANRDGDWADGFNCPPNQAAVEHIVIDRPVNVVALGAGLHTINVATGRVPWPAQFAEQPTWVRITLSDRPSNKPLTFGGINYGDGRGFAVPFRTGETEDYYAHPEGTTGTGPDMGVDLNGDVVHGSWQIIGPYANLVITVTEQVRFKIDFANVGSRPANGATLVFHIPSQLQHQTLNLLQAARIQPTSVISTNTAITFSLPAIPPGDDGTIVLGWALYPGVVEQAETYTGSARVTVAGDLDLSNNQDTAAVTPHVPEPIVVALALNTSTWGAADTTCRTTVNFAGLGVAGQTVQLLLDDQPAGTALPDEDGLFNFQLSNLSAGQHRVRARYSAGTNRPEIIISPRDPNSGMPTGLINVDPSLPIDPLSLTFTDSQGHIIHPPTLGWSWGLSQSGANLKSGETYEVGVNSCSNETNQRYSIVDGTSNTLLVGLRDDDGDGRYTGSYIHNPIVQHGPTANGDVMLSVTSGGVEQSYSLLLQTLTSGIVRDALTGQPLANAAIAALGAESNGSSKPIFSAWPSAALGQSNPITTGVDGAYSFNTPGALNRVEVIRSGYQSYRSWDLAADQGTIAQDLDLTPDLTGIPAYTITITDEGFEPSFLKVTPGSSIAWVNVSLNEHTSTGAAWNSGTLGAGQTYRFRLNTLGTQSYRDDANPLNTAVIVVEYKQLYLPIILR